MGFVLKEMPDVVVKKYGNTMLQYIINASIIWLAALLLYEWLLRKEHFHQYNRVFLLVSLVAGLLLPLAKPDSLIPTGSHALRRPAAEVYELKKTLFINEPAAVAAPSGTSPSVARATPSGFNPQPILWFVYFAGVSAGLLFVTRELLYLLRLYRRGRKRGEDGCLVVETGEVHSPFSFFNLVFVGSRAAYNDDQWRLLMAHEKEHSRRLHSLDNLLLILLRIVCWFHPLPHIYYRRLRTVHEFQADRAAAAGSEGYGAFLIEQSMLRGAPVLTHSINRSPIKSRIAMLTAAKATRARLLKYLAIIPLSLFLVLFCTKTSFSRKGDSNSNRAHFKGNEIELSNRKAYPDWYLGVLEKQKNSFVYPPQPDSIPVEDLRTGRRQMMAVPVETVPVAINGKPIFGNEPRFKPSNGGVVYTAPVLEEAGKDLEQFLFSKLRDDVSKLEDGIYTFGVSNVVIDEQGRIAYYETKGISHVGPRDLVPAISEGLKKPIDQKTVDVLESGLHFRPALKDGKPANVRLDFELHQIEVKGHTARLREPVGC